VNFKRKWKHPEMVAFNAKRIKAEAAKMRAIALKYCQTPEGLETTLVGLSPIQRNAVIELVRQYLPFEPPTVKAEIED
jgi:hypothetical protein